MDVLSENDDNTSTAKVLGKVVWYNQGISNTSKMGIEFLTQSKELEHEYELKDYH